MLLIWTKTTIDLYRLVKNYKDIVPRSDLVNYQATTTNRLAELSFVTLTEDDP